MAKTFNEFILDASGDPELIGGFYDIVSQPNYLNSQLENYLNGKDYEIKPQEINKVKSLHYQAKNFFDVHNRDY
jgi:hypothetical protein